MDGVVIKILAVLITLVARLLFRVIIMPMGTPIRMARRQATPTIKICSKVNSIHLDELSVI
jgi:hypothetical protein